ncbi:hypothetical protein AAFF_G00206850 [Aldrovandia affinis]|uniref:Uncharacterized protein n=1 Tax=Aldrovandia affinis TaxID=143900 RepID=A0AAD7R299_9TELE|nr:hypothetical protein AAFF_G00206850 [Aldrovandia affinis]
MVISSPGYPGGDVSGGVQQWRGCFRIELSLVYLSSLSLTRATVSRKISVRCLSNTTGIVDHAQTVCQFSSTVLRQGASMTALVSLAVSDPSALTERVTVNAVRQQCVSLSISNSKNENACTLQDNTDTFSPLSGLPVNIIVKEEDSTQYLSLPGNKLLEHTFKDTRGAQCEIGALPRTDNSTALHQIATVLRFSSARRTGTIIPSVLLGCCCCWLSSGFCTRLNFKTTRKNEGDGDLQQPNQQSAQTTACRAPGGRETEQ